MQHQTSTRTIADKYIFGPVCIEKDLTHYVVGLVLFLFLLMVTVGIRKLVNSTKTKG